MILLVMPNYEKVASKTFICRVCEFGGDDCVHNESVEDTRIPTKYCSMIIVNIIMILNIKTPGYPSSMKIRMSQKTFFVILLFFLDQSCEMVNRYTKKVSKL